MHDAVSLSCDIDPETTEVVDPASRFIPDLTEYNRRLKIAVDHIEAGNLKLVGFAPNMGVEFGVVLLADFASWAEGPPMKWRLPERFPRAASTVEPAKSIPTSGEITDMPPRVSKAPPIRNRTVLALAEVVSACFDFQINMGGKVEGRVRPDWFADFLYADEYPAALVQLARQVQPQHGAIKYFVLGLDSRTGTTPQLAAIAGRPDEQPMASQRVLVKLAEDILRYPDRDECHLKPGSWLIERLTACLELDGYELSNGSLRVREANVFDVEEESGALLSLFKKLQLERSDQVSADLKLADEHYTAGKWGDSIKHARDVLETTLLGVARAVAVASKKNLPRSALPGPVRTFLESNAIINSEEREFLYALHTILSIQGGHANMSEHEHARICRQYALTAAHFILLRYESLAGAAAGTS